jgi:hypothetical protein
MKFIQKLNLLVEGIGSSRNIYRLTPIFQIHKDENFLMIADFLYGLKKIIEYINEEIEDHNKKAKIKIPIYKLKIKDNIYQSVKKEVIDVVSDFINNDLNNRDLFKKQLIKTLIELFKKQNQQSDFYVFCIHNIKEMEFLITRLDNKYKYIVDSYTIMNYKGIIHDLIIHLFLNPKDINIFDSDTEGYDPYLTYRYSPTSILNELIAQQTNYIKFYSYYIKLSITSIKKDFKKIIEESKEEDFIEKKFNEIFNLKNKVLTQKIKNIILNNKNEDFNFDELQTINILLKNSSYKQNFKTTLEYLDSITSEKRITTINKNIDDYADQSEGEKLPGYQFIERVIESIKFRKNKFSKDKNQTVNWKDFRIYFRDYPYILKLFPESKHPNNQIINNKNLEDDLLELLPEEKPELIKINHIIQRSVNIGQVLTKKSRTGTFDIENKEDKIDFVIERFSNLLKNQFNDNSKYYAMIDKELKSL